MKSKIIKHWCRNLFILVMICLGPVSLFSAAAKASSAEDSVFLDLDVSPGQYDTALYDMALNTVYYEAATNKSSQELLLVTDRDDMGTVQVQADEENGTITYTFPRTFNAIGDRTDTFGNNAFIRSIDISASGTDTVVTVSYRKACLFETSQEEDSVLAAFAEADYSIRLKLPDGVGAEQISDTDYYYKNTFTLKMPGEWKSYYNEHPVTTHNNVITSVDVSESGSSTIVTVKTDKLQGYKLSEKNGYLLVNVDNPRNIYKNIVVLDAGHGGKDRGARHNGVCEKNINFKIMYTLAQKYFNAPDSDVKAYWSRHNDTFISLSDRARFASKVGADLFVSLHMNSAYNHSANGLEAYYSPDNNRAADTGLTSQILAKRMHNTLEENLSIPSRGVKRAGFYVMKHNTVPAILIELGFLSGNRDFAKLTSPGYQEKAARYIYESIADTFQKYPTSR